MSDKCIDPNSVYNIFFVSSSPEDFRVNVLNHSIKDMMLQTKNEDGRVGIEIIIAKNKNENKIVNLQKQNLQKNTEIKMCKKIITHITNTAYYENHNFKQSYKFANKFITFLEDKNISMKEVEYFKHYVLNNFSFYYMGYVDSLKGEELEILKNLAKINEQNSIGDRTIEKKTTLLQDGLVKVRHEQKEVGINFYPALLRQLSMEKDFGVFFSPAVLASLFKNGITYLFDYRLYQNKYDDFLINLSQEMKGFTKEFLVNLPEIDKKTIINKELYKFENSELEIFDVLSLFKNDKFIKDIYESKDFLNKEYSFTKKLIEEHKSLVFYKDIYSNLNKIKSPKYHTQILMKHMKHEIEVLEKMDHNVEIFNVVTPEKVCKLSIGISKSNFTKSIAYGIQNFFKTLNETELQKLYINEILINIKLKDETGVMHVSILYDNEKISDEYFKSIFLKLKDSEGDLQRVFYTKKNILKDLDEVRLLFLMDDSTVNAITKTNKRKKI